MPDPILPRLPQEESKLKPCPYDPHKVEQTKHCWNMAKSIKSYFEDTYVDAECKIVELVRERHNDGSVKQITLWASCQGSIRR